MRGTLRLALRYLQHNALQSGLLAACVALALLVPAAARRLVDVYGRELVARADATPLVVGAQGSRYDLVLNALYFRGRVPRPTSWAELRSIAASGLGLPVPLLARRTVSGLPLVGTSLDYFRMRGLALAEGELPAELGDAVLGAGAARALGVAAGGKVLTDQGSLYDLSLGYPLRLSVVGVLAQSGTPDDGAVFCDVKTAWVVEGIGHGHVAAEEEGTERVLARRDDEVVLGAATVEYTEITPENAAAFHFHGEPTEFPLTAVLVEPAGERGATLLKGRYRVAEAAQALVPRDVVDELLGLVLRLKLFFDANAVLVGLSTALFLVLLVSLSIRVRRRELETLERIGIARAAMARLLATELLLVLLAGVGLGLAAGRLAADWIAGSYGLG